MTGYRKIVVLGKTWEYRIGKSHLKVKGLPAIDFSALTGMSFNDIEKGRHKRWFSITPKDVKGFIEGIA